MSEKTYALVEMFATVQGEGSRTGHRSVFARFAGCNAWNGYDRDRSKGRGACSAWCDTNFTSTNARVTAAQFVEHVQRLWPLDDSRKGEVRWVVLTGGEPFLQVDAELLRALRDANIAVAIETNGSVAVDEATIDAVCACVDLLTVSPKRGLSLHAPLIEAHPMYRELKVVLPGGREDDGSDGWTDDELVELAGRVDWDYTYVQPQDPHVAAFVGATYLTDTGTPSFVARGRKLYRQRVQRCLAFIESPRGAGWKISAQTHKLLVLP